VTGWFIKAGGLEYELPWPSVRGLERANKPLPSPSGEGLPSRRLGLGVRWIDSRRVVRGGGKGKLDDRFQKYERK